jgi:arginase
MSDVALIAVPYHLGHKGVGLAKGVPVLVDALGGGGREVEYEADFTNEVAASMGVIRRLADVVGEVVRAGQFPLVVAGNCNSSLGTVAGIGGGVGVVWFDAHADFNTPDTSESGFFDGFGLAMLTGSGWPKLREGLPAIPEEHVVLAGARDIDQGERERLEASRLQAAPVAQLEPALDDLRTRVDSVYLHVDLDVLDPSVGRANWFAVDDGPNVDELANAVDAIGERFTIRAAALTAYTPDADPEGTIPPAARVVFDRIVAAVGRVPA